MHLFSLFLSLHFHIAPGFDCVSLGILQVFRVLRLKVFNVICFCCYVVKPQVKPCLFSCNQNAIIITEYVVYMSLFQSTALPYACVLHTFLSRLCGTLEREMKTHHSNTKFNGNNKRTTHKYIYTECDNLDIE